MSVFFLLAQGALRIQCDVIFSICIVVKEPFSLHLNYCMFLELVEFLLMWRLPVFSYSRIHWLSLELYVFVCRIVLWVSSMMDQVLSISYHQIPLLYALLQSPYQRTCRFFRRHPPSPADVPCSPPTDSPTLYPLCLSGKG